MSAYSKHDHFMAAQRLVRFAQRGNIAPVLRKHAPFLRTDTGSRVWMQLSILADLALCGDVSTNEYEARLHGLMGQTAIPRRELKIVARLALEWVRCCFFGQGFSPIVDVDESGVNE